MAMVGTDIKTMAFIRSEEEFNRAKMAGFWDVLFSLVTGQPKSLLAFDDAVEELPSRQATELGLQDIPIASIVGSVDRFRDYSPHFLPRFNDRNSKERWRELYTLTITGGAVPPVELYKIGQQYFVKDGHHRISVAKYLAWDTIQANVVEITAPVICPPNSGHQLNLCVCGSRRP